ncbi:extracellular solute-binding protein [Bacillus salitolerans]|uniref:Extracellular solute-binding protein n=1 Tax=Bacillus salitolerans TaxID=1437434 RepID=A0ABW4LQD7_9BACI
MKMWKSVLSLLLVSSFLLLAACGGNESQDEGNNSGNDKESGSVDKISIFVSKVEITEQLEALAKEYEKETGVEVEVWGTTGDDYFQQLQIRLNSDQGPSIFSLRHLTEAKAMESYAYDLSNEEYVQYIAENMALELNGKVLGIPFGVEGFGLVYNKDLVDPADVADYDSFVNTLKKFNGTDVSGLSLSQEGFFLIGHISNYPFSLQQDNIAFMDQLTAGEVTLAETEEFQKFGELMEVLRENSRNPLEVTYDSQIGDFASGKTAMIHQGNWANGMLADYDIDFEYGMLPVPLMDNDKLAVGVGMNWSVNAMKDEAEIQAALDFLEWMHTSETGHKYIVEEFKAIPALTNITPGELDPLSQTVFEATNSGNTIKWSHTYYPANVVVNDFVPAAQNFFINKDVSGQEFIQQLDEAWKNASK